MQLFFQLLSNYIDICNYNDIEMITTTLVYSFIVLWQRVTMSISSMQRFIIIKCFKVA